MNVAAYPTYDGYLDSGVQWVGKFPSDWELTRLGGLFSERRMKVSDTDFEALSVTKNGIFPQLETAAKTNDGDNRKLVKAGDFVINSRSDRKGSSGVSPLDGSVSLINIVLEPKRILPEFCHHLLKSYAFVEEYYRVGRGIVADLWTTRFDEMRTILVALPSPDEQRAIAAFLNEKCTTIDEAVRIKEEQITLLRERRQILIQQAVTRGLNPDAPMKDSGIDWIGKIPAHWEVKPLTAEAKLKSVANRPELELLSVYLDRGVVKFSDVDEKRTNATSLDLSNYQHVLRGDLVLNNQQAWRGSVGVSFHEGIVSPAYIILKLSSRWDADFANLFFRSGPMVSQYLVASKGVGTIQRNLYWPKLKRANVTIPPIEEQRDITRHVQAQCEKIDAGIQTKDGQIATLKEYKTSLINAAVTGKIKVT
ncbi:MAG: restriction endonuclease subunit S [Sulfitobacter litoralis]|uniref:restriction endonuclease subunit S n=1 Tax=Sulfitobacter litoralis TaxID=335975 RepID=UPI00300279DD